MLTNTVINLLLLPDNNDGHVYTLWHDKNSNSYLTTSVLGKTGCCGSVTIGNTPYFREDWFLQIVKEARVSIILWGGYDRSCAWDDVCLQAFCTRMNKNLEGVCRFSCITLASKEHLFLIETLDKVKFSAWQTT